MNLCNNLTWPIAYYSCPAHILLPNLHLYPAHPHLAHNRHNSNPHPAQCLHLHLYISPLLFWLSNSWHVVSLGFSKPNDIQIFTIVSLNPHYHVIMCMPFVTRIGKWLWMMNLMLLLKIRRESWCPVRLMLIWFGLYGFLLIKKNLMVFLRGMRPVL